jgi:hypothetical protein
MLPHIELDRIFLPYKDEDESAPDMLRAMAEFGLDRMHWSDLLAMTRVVILAEAGTGKTHEILETARRLRREGKTAFFCHIEDLAADSFWNALSEGNRGEFDTWVEGSKASWFFLDSVDEARLANPRFFERALRKLARTLDHATSRAHIFITARVSDWRATADLLLVRDILPLPIALNNVDPHQDERTTITFDGGIERTSEERDVKGDIRVVQLAPLTADQRRQFVAGQGVPDVTAFMDAIERSDADIFAERPADLLELIAYWTQHGAIGTHAEMIAFNIETKLREPNPDRDEMRPLAKTHALQGAQLLAAALTFTRKNSIILPDQPVDPTRAWQAINAKDLLPDWDARDLQTLLDRALFDEATYGRVRFHHRSIREYLTAWWLYDLLESGKPRRAIEGLLFARSYGLDVIVPSMKPIAAWLALWDDRFRDLMLIVAPEILIEHGDPSRLPIEIRSRLLRQFASLHERQSDTGASFDNASVRRLVDPRLATTVLDLLDHHRENEDVRQLLLRIVWQGKISDCAETALSFALDTTIDPYTRICGIWAIGTAGNKNQRRRLAEAVLTNITNWESRGLGEAVEALFPESLTVDELLTILEAVNPPPRYSVTSLEGALKELVSGTCPPSHQEPLLVGLVRLLEREPHIDPRHRAVSQRYVWLLGYAAKLAERVILNTKAMIPRFYNAVLRAIELDVMEQVWGSNYYRPDHTLPELIGELPTLRHALFWRAVERQRKVLSAEGKQLTEWWQARFGAPVRQLSSGDFDVFLADVHRHTEMDDRLVALTAAFAIWRDGGRGRKGRERMWRAVKGEPDLEAKLHALLHPGPSSEDERRYRRSEQNFKRRHAKQKARKVQSRRK